jgi:hypothetical protein
MIKGITIGQSGGYISSGTNGYVPYVSPNTSNPLTGMVRVNGNNLEVFDGSSWMQMGSYADVSLSQSAIAALDWCQRKMVEEAKIKELCNRSPAVADAFATYSDAKNKLEMVLTLADQTQKSL